MKRSEYIDNLTSFVMKYHDNDKLMMELARLLREDEDRLSSVFHNCNILSDMCGRYYSIAEHKYLICSKCTSKYICDETIGEKEWCKNVTADG